MRNRKRSILTHLVYLFTALMLILGLVGCADNAGNVPSSGDIDLSTGGEEVIITFAYDENYRTLIEPLMDAFHEENPSITVQFVPLSTTNYSQAETLEDRLLALATGADTTLTFSGSPQAGSYFLDLQPLMDADSSFASSDFWPGSLSALEDTEGRVLGLPMTLFLRGIFYDKAAFDAANLAYPQPGWTWDDFRRMTAALAQGQGGESRFGYADRASLSILQPLIGYELTLNDGQIDAEALAAELDWYVQLAQADQILGVKSSDDYWNGLFDFGTPPAMWYANLLEFTSDMEMGETAATDLKTYFEDSAYGFAPLPVDADRENVNTTPVNALSGVISAGSEHPVEAWQWLNFLSHHSLALSNADPGERLNVPARQSVTEAVGFWDSFPPEVQAAIRFGLEHAWYPSVYSRAEEAVLSAVREAASGYVDLTSALEEAETAQASWPQDRVELLEIVVATSQSVVDVVPGTAVINFNYRDWLPNDVRIFESLISEFNHEHEGEIIVQATNVQQSSYEGGYFVGRSNLYDCYMDQNMSEYAASSEAVLDLTALFEGEDAAFQQDFDNSLLDSSRSEGYLVALPLSIQPGLMAYNADMLAQKGLEPPALDWTFDDFLELITAVTSTVESDKSYGFLPSTNAASIRQMFYAGRGVQWRDISGADPVVMFNTPEMADTLIWLDELERSGVTYQVPDVDDWNVAIAQPVRAGQIGFFITYAGEEEELYFLGNKPPYTIGIAPLPATPKPNGSFGDNYETGFYISKNSEHPEACWELGKYLSEHTEGLNGVPARTSVANSSAWEAQVGPEKAAVYRKALANNLANNEADPYGVYFWAPMRGWLGRASVNISNGSDPTQELALAQQYADAYLDCMMPLDIPSLTNEEIRGAVQECEVQVDPSHYE
jgi:multiple sugar transport system substrate-binding protein